MTDRSMLIPNDEHPIAIAPTDARVRVRAGETVVADTDAALTLQEARYPTVQYIPRADAAMAQLRRSDHSSYCPYKGEASYYDVPALGEAGRNAVWTYETPYPAVAGIAGHLAFYPDRVAVELLERQAG